MNKLSPVVLSQIFGLKETAGFSSTAGLMNDRIYHYSRKRKERVELFFREIAPQAQHSQEIFRFIEEITGDEDKNMPLEFLEELIEFLRNAHIFRQSLLRHMELSEIIDRSYLNLLERLAPQTNAAELAGLAGEIERSIRGIRYNNITSAVVMPALLINIARWYQRRWR